MGGRFDIEKQQRNDYEREEDGGWAASENAAVTQTQESIQNSTDVVLIVDSPNKSEAEAEPQLSRNSTSHQQCRVCQEEKEEALINLGCQCRGGLGKAHQSCIIKWFNTRGSNKCEICQQVASNVAPPDSQTGYWDWRVDPAFRGTNIAQERERGCFSPIWVAFSILIGGLLLDVLISITLGVSALPVNIIIGTYFFQVIGLKYAQNSRFLVCKTERILCYEGVIVVLGLGTALRLALEFCQEWNVRRVVQRVEANANLGYHPAL